MKSFQTLSSGTVASTLHGSDDKPSVPELRDHSDLLNFIAEKINAKTYLEIGVFNPEHNFNKIKVQRKVSIDPDPNAQAVVRMTSDDYFLLFPSVKYDLVFCDGLHHADQVKRDIQNSWGCLNEGGVIVIHDCNPHSESITHVPRDSREWCGDVWKAAIDICHYLKFTVDFDYGCCIVRKEQPGPLFDHAPESSWETFDKHRKELLNLVSVNEAIQIINSWK